MVQYRRQSLRLIETGEPPVENPLHLHGNPAREPLPTRGFPYPPIMGERGAMSRRFLHHTLLPRVARGLSRRSRRVAIGPLKHAIKRATMRDCGRRCVYCATPLDIAAATLDHVHPRAHGGAHTSGNLVAACRPCNLLKGDLLPQDFFSRYPWAGANFIRYARAAHRALKRGARRAVSLAGAAA